MLAARAMKQPHFRVDQLISAEEGREEYHGGGLSEASQHSPVPTSAAKKELTGGSSKPGVVRTVLQMVLSHWEPDCMSPRPWKHQEVAGYIPSSKQELGHEQAMP